MKPLKQRTAAAILLLIIAVFVIPYVFAWFFYEKDEQKPVGGFSTTNYGYLISPPLTLKELEITNSNTTPLAHPLTTVRTQGDSGEVLLGKWLLFSIIPHQCGTPCQNSLYAMRQIRLAMNAEQNRVARAVVSFSNPQNDVRLQQLLHQDYAETLSLRADRMHFQDVVNAVVKLNYIVAEGTLYIADPLGNVILVYEPGADPNKIFKDLHHLLQVSQIG